MALLLPHLSLTPSPSPFSSRSAALLHISSNVSLRLQDKLNLHSRSFNGVRVSSSSASGQRSLMIVRASSETDGKNESDAALSVGSQETAPVDSLPLESKLKLMAEQKLKMKLAKKLRLRRKRLVRKRHLRKKGRWPPSKMKKLKNV